MRTCLQLITLLVFQNVGHDVITSHKNQCKNHGDFLPFMLGFDRVSREQTFCIIRYNVVWVKKTPKSNNNSDTVNWPSDEKRLKRIFSKQVARVSRIRKDYFTTGILRVKNTIMKNLLIDLWTPSYCIILESFRKWSKYNLTTFFENLNFYRFAKNLKCFKYVSKKVIIFKNS